MNTLPHFRYYLACVLLVLLGLTIRVQNGGSAPEPPAAVATPLTTRPLLAQQ